MLSDEPAANPRYRYVTVEVQPNARPAKVALVMKSARGKVRTEWELKARRTRTAAPGLSQRDLMYLITPDRFANADAGNDDVAGMA